MSWRNYDAYRPARQTKGGIKAQTRRGAFAQTWWGQHWLSTLEGVYTGGRLERGKLYARKGQVLSLTFPTDFSEDGDTAAIQALVQGSDPDPYDVSIHLKPFPQKTWSMLLGKLASQPLLAAQLLAGTLPQTIQPMLEKSGLSLLPNTRRDITAHCSCPDGVVPCKHIAAVYYLCAEALDQDPFWLFHWRGMPRDMLLRRLERYHRSPHEGDAVADEARPALTSAIPVCEPAPPPQAPLSPEAYWEGSAPFQPIALPPMTPPTMSAALPKRLGAFPLWRGEEAFLPRLETLYRQASQACFAALSERAATASPLSSTER